MKQSNREPLKKNKIIKRLMYISLIIILGIVVATLILRPKFGKVPGGERLERIKKSPNYQDGAFQNLNPTSIMVEGVSYISLIKKFIFADNKKPVDSIPSVKTDLINLDPEKDVLIWFGHSSYFIQIDGKKILVDPVFSGSASPVSFTTKAFKGTNIFTPDDIPEIDFLFITHDHWDHMDHRSLLELKSKVKKVICGLGTAAHLEYWGYDTSIIIEEEWNKEIELGDGFVAHTIPARHFSGRGFRRNRSLWTSFVLLTPTMKIFLGCDGGYDTHFTEAGKTFGEFDLAILENGQYNESWKYIHMMPGEVLQAAKDLGAKRVLPIHSCKFALANHSWDEPLKRITELNKGFNLSLITPVIGEEVYLKDSCQQFSQWWTTLK